MFYAAHGRTAMVTDAVSPDADGNPTAAAAARPVDGVVIQEESTTTNVTEHGNLAVTTVRALFPEDDPITLGATVQFPPREGKFRVVGDPEPAHSQLSGRSFGLIVELKKVGSRRT